jgi:hypothetical protein
MTGMPISFYCPFCNLLMATSRRQIGTVVVCGRCQGHVGVPAENAPPPAVAPDGLVLHWFYVVLGVLGALALLGLAFGLGTLIGWLL